MSSVDLTNTPGYYYAVAYWISEVRLIILFRNSRSRMEVEMLKKTLQMQYDNYKKAKVLSFANGVNVRADASKDSDELLCRCLQHELDHLDGITLFERLSPLDRLAKLEEYKAAVERGAKPGEC